MTRLVSVRLILLTVIFVPVLVVAAQGQTESRKARFDLPAQALADSLRAVGAQTSVNVVFEPSSVRGKRAPTLRGEYTVQEALGLLLDGTGLRIRLTAGGSYVIEALRTGASGAAEGGLQLALVANNEEPQEQTGRDAGRKADEDAEVIVEDTRIKPFSTPSVDLPRSNNDVQPYYIIDAQTLERSSALNLEDFLKKRLTMNAVSRTDMEMTNSVLIARSTVDLRGLGRDGTLILINGRRSAPIQLPAGTVQPDINGIPMSAVERIEVLPTSASGIYGGNAVGGVVNIITRRDYQGGELRMNYDNPADTDAARRSVDGTWGFSLENGRTQFMVSAGWSDSGVLTRGDREFLWARWRDTVLRNAPWLIQGSAFPPLASTPNIRSVGGEPLVLDNDVPLNASSTHIPVGFGPQGGLASLYQALLANAGTYNLQTAPTSQWGGSLQPIGTAPEVGNAAISFRRRMSERLELFTDLSYRATRTVSLYNPWDGGGTFVSAAAPANPFQQTIYVTFPNALDVEQYSYSVSRAATFGAVADLPWNWRTEADFSWSDNRYQYEFLQVDPAFSSDVASGALNLFVDTLAHQPDLARYIVPSRSSSSSRLYDGSLRGSGPLPVLPWGAANLTFGLQYRKFVAPQRSVHTILPLSPNFSSISTYFRRDQSTVSGYLEALAPLAPAGRFRAIHGLDLQIAARAERYTVETGTPGMQERPATGLIFYMPPTNAGEPFDASATYTSRNGTVGLRYRPVESVMVRISRATAFLPPTPAQLTPNPSPSPPQEIADPIVGGPPYPVQTQSGGNPNLVPQNSRSFNAGIVWEPAHGRLKGLRVNVERYEIEQFDRIGNLTAQQIVNDESAYPGRVVRDPVTNRVTFVDTSMVNLYQYDTAGWEFSIDYRWSGAAGTFTLHAVETLVDHERRQTSLLAPAMDYANHVADGGPVRERANVELTWERRNWQLGWNAQYYGHYKQRGAAGGPSEWDSDRVLAQGREILPAQMYHNLFFGIGFGGRAGAGVRAGHLLDGLSLIAGVNNVFDTLPPYDALDTYSRFGDIRLRSYWVSLKKRF